jgi:hypothetical protein
MMKRSSMGSYLSPVMRRSSMGSYPSPVRRSPRLPQTPTSNKSKTKSQQTPASILRPECFYSGPPLACFSPIRSPGRQDLVHLSSREVRRRVTFDIPDEASVCYSTDASIQFGDMEEYIQEDEHNPMPFYDNEMMGRGDVYTMMMGNCHELGLRAILPFGDDFDDSERFGILHEEAEAPVYRHMIGQEDAKEEGEEAAAADVMEGIHGMDSGDELSVSSATSNEDPLIGDQNIASTRVRAIEGLTKVEETFQRKLDLSGFEDRRDDIPPPPHSREASAMSETSSESPKGVHEFQEDPCQRDAEGDPANVMPKETDSGICSSAALP